MLEKYCKHPPKCSMEFSPDSLSILAAIFTLALAIFWIRFCVFGGFFEEEEEKNKKNKKKKRYAPIVGTVFSMLSNFDRLHDYMTGLARKHKTYRFLDLSMSQVNTSDPANVEYILKTNFTNYGKGYFHYGILADLLGDGIFTVDGEKWRQQRKFSSFEFSTKMLREFSSEVFRNNAVRLARIVSEASTSNQPIEVQGLLMKSTLDSVFKVVFGVNLNSICGTNEEGALFINAFEEASAITMLRYVDIFWKMKRFLNIGSEAKLRKCVQVVDKFVYKLISSKIEQLNTLQDGLQVKKRDLLSRFLDLNETDPKYLKDIILSFIIAGKDTTAGTLSWFLYIICKHPFVQERIAEEVLKATKVEENSRFDDIAANIDEGALDKMRYLHAALTETLRLYPAVPLDGKICFSDDILPDGISVRKGDQVAYQPYAMGRMKWLWGDDAEDFRPERWLNDENTFQQQSPFKFTAFQAGPRICLGKEFAYRQMKIFAAVLIGSFIFKLSDEQMPVNYKTMLTLHIDGGLHLRAYPRNTNLSFA